jgi:Protein of unknown function (DUF3148)
MSQDLTIGMTVQLVMLPPYLKTADPMPMLRPSNLLEVGAEGIIFDRRPGNYWAVKFDRSSFLLESRYLEIVIS